MMKPPAYMTIKSPVSPLRACNALRGHLLISNRKKHRLIPMIFHIPGELSAPVMIRLEVRTQSLCLWVSAAVSHP
jgi:hypothetical protein